MALAIFFEGEAVIYSVMYLAFERLLPLHIVVPVICASVLATDFISYKIGQHGHKFFPRLAAGYGRLTAPMDSRLQRLSLSVYLISKFAYGLHRAVLIRSGMIGIPFRRLFVINLLTSTIWIAVISGAAYASWRSISIVKTSLHFFELGLIVGIIAIIAGSHIIGLIARAKMAREHAPTDHSK